VSWPAEFKISWGTARAAARLARALDEMPETRHALKAGDVSLSAARVLAAAHDADPGAFGRSEGELVEAARIHRVGDLQRVAAYWCETLDREHAMRGEDRFQARRRLAAHDSSGPQVHHRRDVEKPQSVIITLDEPPRRPDGR